MQLEDNIGREIAEIIKNQISPCHAQVVRLEKQLVDIDAKLPGKGDIADNLRYLSDENDKLRRQLMNMSAALDNLTSNDVFNSFISKKIEKIVSELPKPRDGANGKDGRDGKDGAPGNNGEKGEPGPQGLPGLDGKDGAGPSRGRYRGPWKHDEEFHLDDMVSSGGSGWVCMVEGAKDRPGDSKQWQLFVKKGNHGKDGERGPPGPQGPIGKYEP